MKNKILDFLDVFFYNELVLLLIILAWLCFTCGSCIFSVIILDYYGFSDMAIIGVIFIEIAASFMLAAVIAFIVSNTNRYRD